MRHLLYLGISLIFVLAVSCNKSQQLPDASDYARAVSFNSDSIRSKVYHLSVRPQWFDDSSGFAYRTNTRNGERYYTVSIPDFKKQPAFNRERLANALSEVSGHRFSENNLSPRYIRWKDKNHITFSVDNNRYSVNLTDYHIKQVSNNDRRDFRKNSSVSPNKRYQVYLKDYNLYLKDRETGSVTPLSTDGSKLYIYGSRYGWGELMKGEDAGPAPHLTVNWSPNSKMFATQIEDARKGKRMYLLNDVVDSLYRPVLLSYFRSSPGDTNDVDYIPVIYDVRTHRMVKIDLPSLPHYLGVNLRWTKDNRLIGSYYHRGFKKMDIIQVNPETGDVRTIWTDSAKTSLKYDHIHIRYLFDRGFAFITCEKSGWNQIYRLNLKSGEIHSVTQGDYVVKNIVSIDTTNKVVYFMASGKEKGVNPYFNSLYKVHFDGSGLTSLTPEPVNHQVFLSSNSKYFVDNGSTATKPTVSLLRSTQDGKILMKIDSADVKDLKKMGWHPPQIFTAIARDGKTKIYGALWKPTNFNPHHQYPLIDYTYTGPQTNVFPNTFSRGLSGLYRHAQSLAELGFIVMQVDGLGTNGRSQAFQNWSYENMGQNLKGHVLAIRQLGKKYSWIDTTRVGIYGHSAGGYDAAHALEAFHNIYKVAVAESGDHDWRMEKAWWPEMYVGWPVGANYEKQNNIAMAPELKGKLLLIHGGIDENVNPSSTFRLSEALIKAGKYFDLLIIPSSHHGYPRDYQSYVTKKRWHFFVQNLIVNPVE